MSVSNIVKGLLAIRGKKQIDLATCFGMTKQTMSNKFARNSWFATDLIKVADFLRLQTGVYPAKWPADHH